MTGQPSASGELEERLARHALMLPRRHRRGIHPRRAPSTAPRSASSAAFVSCPGPAVTPVPRRFPPGAPREREARPARRRSGSRSGRLACTGPGPAGGPRRSPRATRRDAGAERHEERDSLRRARAKSRSEARRRAAVEADLLGGLGRADLMELGRSVGGEHDQRHPREVRLDHRGVHLCGGGAARRQHHRGAAARERGADREERR